MTGLRDGERLRVVAGSPTPEEIAVLVAVLDGVPAVGRTIRRRPAVAAWTRAARREALGGPPVATPADLTGPA